MKPWITCAAAAALSLAACSQPAEVETPQTEQRLPVNVASGEYELDRHHTTVTVRAQHFGLSDYVLRFNSVRGALNFNAEDPSQSSVTAEVDLTSLDTPYTGERDFDAELQNSAWLDAAASSVATFRSTAVESTGPNTARVTGDLSFRGRTLPVSFDVTYLGSHAEHPLGAPIAMIGFSARGSLNRSQYGIQELQPSGPGAADGVSDEVEVLIEAEFTRPAQQASDMPAPVAPAEPVD